MTKFSALVMLKIQYHIVGFVLGWVWFDFYLLPKLGFKGGNRDYCSHISVTLEASGKFLVVFVRLILGKVGVDLLVDLLFDVK